MYDVFIDMRLLAQGSYASVYVADDEVVKIMPKYIDGYLNYHAIIDLSIQKTFGDTIPGVPKISSYKIDDETIEMRMPFYGGFVSHKNVQRELIPEIIQQLVYTLLQLQENGVQHTDIKPNNVLYDSQNHRVTLIDYNMISQLIIITGKPEWGPSYGTWNFCAPEILNDSAPSNTSSVWSAAFIMAYLYARYPIPEIYKTPSKYLSSRTYWKKIFGQLRDLYPDKFPLGVAHVKCMPPKILHIFSQATTWDPDKRMTLKEMFKALASSEPPCIFPQLLSLNVATLSPLIRRLYNICRATKTKPVFARAAYIFQKYGESATYVSACAAHYIAVMLTGSYIFNDKDFVINTMCYWGLKDEKVVENEMISILNTVDWQVWGLTLDLQNPNWSFKDLLVNDDKVATY